MVSFFSIYVQLKSSSDKKKTAVKSETHFSRGAIKVQRGKVLNKNAIIDRSWSSAKLFIMPNCTDISNEHVPLTVENVCDLICFEIKVRTCSFGKKNKSYSINRFLYEKYFY